MVGSGLLKKSPPYLALSTIFSSESLAVENLLVWTLSDIHKSIKFIGIMGQEHLNSSSFVAFPSSRAVTTVDSTYLIRLFSFRFFVLVRLY